MTGARAAAAAAAATEARIGARRGRGRLIVTPRATAVGLWPGRRRRGSTGTLDAPCARRVCACVRDARSTEGA